MAGIGCTPLPSRAPFLVHFIPPGTWRQVFWSSTWCPCIYRWQLWLCVYRASGSSCRKYRCRWGLGMRPAPWFFVRAPKRGEIWQREGRDVGVLGVCRRRGGRDATAVRVPHRPGESQTCLIQLKSGLGDALQAGMPMEGTIRDGCFWRNAGLLLLNSSLCPWIQIQAGPPAHRNNASR